MYSISDKIMEYAEARPEGSLLCPNEFLDMGSRAAVYQALSRLTRQRMLKRIHQGIYVRTIKTRFGMRPPDFNKVIEELSKFWGVIIVPSGGGSANFLGLTEQVPVVLSYLTSGPNRELQFYTKVKLRHAPRWQLLAPYRRAGTVIRALTFLSPSEAEEALSKVVPRLAEEDLAEILSLRRMLPAWIAEPLGDYKHHG